MFWNQFFSNSNGMSEFLYSAVSVKSRLDSRAGTPGSVNCVRTFSWGAAAPQTPRDDGLKTGFGLKSRPSAKISAVSENLGIWARPQNFGSKLLDWLWLWLWLGLVTDFFEKNRSKKK